MSPPEPFGLLANADVVPVNAKSIPAATATVAKRLIGSLLPPPSQAEGPFGPWLTGLRYYGRGRPRVRSVPIGLTTDDPPQAVGAELGEPHRARPTGREVGEGTELGVARSHRDGGTRALDRDPVDDVLLVAVGPQCPGRRRDRLRRAV